MRIIGTSEAIHYVGRGECKHAHAYNMLVATETRFLYEVAMQNKVLLTHANNYADILHAALICSTVSPISF